MFHSRRFAVLVLSVVMAGCELLCGIRTSAADSSLPPAGTRIAPSFSTVMPKLLTATTNVPVLARGLCGLRVLRYGATWARIWRLRR